MKKFLIGISILIFLSVAGAAVLVGYARWWFAAPNSNVSHEVVLEVASGTGLSKIVDELNDAGLIAAPFGVAPTLFKAMVWWQGNVGNFKAGEYQFEAGLSPQAIAEKMVKGESVVYSVTLPEGRNVREALTTLAAQDALDGTISKAPAEGSLMPDTYHIQRHDSRDAVVGRMQKAMQEYLAAHWAQRDEGLPIATPQEWVTLASIVEEETGVASERAVVASVFINRLKRGIMLQSDPTVVYGLEQTAGKKLDRPLTSKDLTTDHPYNTYLHAGLPPAPICNPGRAALEAVLHPAQTDYLYFVATGDGGHRFAATLAEHNQNVAKYRAVVRQWRAEQKQKAQPLP